jgi:hypothetical protein
MSSAPNGKNTSSVLSREIADLDARMTAKQSFASRVGLLPFAAGAAVAATILLAFQFATHF